MQNRTSANIIGPDLNEYRGTVNYTLLATKTNYCYLRGSGSGSGKFREDKRFVEYAEGLKKVGIKTGAYHYAVPSYDLNTADAQCDDFINVLQKAYGPGKYGDLFPVIDIEAPTDKSISTDALLNWVDRFRKRFERKTRRVLMLYTGAFFIELYNNFYHSTKGFILSDMPLWIAMYPEIKPNPPYPKDQGGWTRWRLWQYTESGTMAGVNPPVDLNYGPVNVDLLTQPRDVKNFKAVTFGRNIRLTWTKNSDIDLAGYNIFLNSSYITTLGKNATEYTIELGPQTAPLERYEVSIEAFDTDGDFSPKRSKINVEFKRGEDNSLLVEEEFIPMMLSGTGEVKDDIRDIIDEEEALRLEDSLTYIDPVTRLESKFMGELMSEAKNYQSLNRGLFEDFVEINNEFDDELYLKNLENETVYKSYYNGPRDSSHLDFYDTNDDEDEEDDYIYADDEKKRHKEKHNCKKNPHNSCKKCNTEKEEDDSDSEEDYNDSKESMSVKLPCKKNNKEMKSSCKKCNCDNKFSNIEKMKVKMKGYEVLKECPKDYEEDKEDKGCSYKDKYEGDRRRTENRDNEKSKNICNNCMEDKDKCNSCEYLMYNMYLNNCDYGHKNSGDKKKNKHHNEYCEDKYDKKKKKKKKH